MAPPAAASASASGSNGGADDSNKLTIWKELLYERVREMSRPDDPFSQDDLVDLGVIPNGDKLLLIKVIQALSDDKLFVTMRDHSGNVCWKWREAEEAHKYKQLTDEQVMVYAVIDESGGDGIWSQTILRRLNMHDSVLKKALQALQTKGLIAPFRNVEYPNKKMYIKASIQPSDRATGGPWFTDNEIDEGFIETIRRVVFNYVKVQGSYISRHAATKDRSRAPTKGVLKGGIDKGKKRAASELEEPPTKAVKLQSATPSRHPVLLPLPAGYTAYPTIRDIARFLVTSGITKNTTLSEQELHKLVNTLVWDNLLETVKVSGKVGYRVARIAQQSTENWADQEDGDGAPGQDISAYTELPCGRCPVFDLCEEGGPVGPSNCEYFKRWLGVD